MNTKSFFGKKNINKIKQGFIDDSFELISKDIETYKEIEKIGFNLECNICSTKLSDQVFTKHNIKYYRCVECGMMGAGKISNYSEYNDLLYQDISYGSYTGFEESRLSEIYIPKADYLIKILPDIRERGVIDIGAGLGYFVGEKVNEAIQGEESPITPGTSAAYEAGKTAVGAFAWLPMPYMVPAKLNFGVELAEGLVKEGQKNTFRS